MRHNTLCCITEHRDQHKANGLTFRPVLRCLPHEWHRQAPQMLGQGVGFRAGDGAGKGSVPHSRHPVSVCGSFLKPSPVCSSNEQRAYCFGNKVCRLSFREHALLGPSQTRGREVCCQGQAYGVGQPATSAILPGKGSHGEDLPAYPGAVPEPARKLPANRADQLQGRTCRRDSKKEVRRSPATKFRGPLPGTPVTEPAVPRRLAGGKGGPRLATTGPCWPIPAHGSACLPAVWLGPYFEVERGCGPGDASQAACRRQRPGGPALLDIQATTLGCPGCRRQLPLGFPATPADGRGVRAHEAWPIGGLVQLPLPFVWQRPQIHAYYSY